MHSQYKSIAPRELARIKLERADDEVAQRLIAEIERLLTRTLADRFWAKVRKSDECWLWTASSNNGYGQIRRSGKYGPIEFAHRVSWELHYGAIVDGLWVLHRCDVNYPVGDVTYRRCVRPDHLFLGTVGDNNLDMSQKRRNQRGDAHWSRRTPDRIYGRVWSPEALDALATERADGASISELARRHGRCTARIRHLLKRHDQLRPESQPIPAS